MSDPNLVRVAPPGEDPAAEDPEKRQDEEMEAAAASRSPEQSSTAKREAEAGSHEESSSKLQRVIGPYGGSSSSGVRRAGSPAPDHEETRPDLDEDVVVPISMQDVDAPMLLDPWCTSSPQAL